MKRKNLKPELSQLNKTDLIIVLWYTRALWLRYKISTLTPAKLILPITLASKISQLQHQKTVKIATPTPKQAKTIATRILTDLQTGDPVHTRQTLLSLIHQIKVDRQGKSVVAEIILHFDKKQAPPTTVPTISPPVGAPIYRHSLHTSYQIKKQGNPKPIKKPR